MNCVRLYADDGGETHFEDVDVPLSLVDLAPAVPLIHASEPEPAVAVRFVRAPAGWSGGWHVAPQRAFSLILEGAFEVTVSDGETRLLRAGTAWLMEDTAGKGHVTKAANGEAAVTALVLLE